MKKILFSAVLMFAGSVFASTLADKDTDKDGKLSVEEFAGDKKKLKKKFTKLDADKDGFLNEKEFAKSMKKKGKKEK